MSLECDFLRGDKHFGRYIQITSTAKEVSLPSWLMWMRLKHIFFLISDGFTKAFKHQKTPWKSLGDIIYHTYLYKFEILCIIQ